MTTNHDLAEAITELTEAIADLRARIEGVPEEIRTRRLVVVDEDGFERVVIRALAGSGAVTVFGKPSRSDALDGMSVSVMASEESLEPDAGLYVNGGEHMVTNLSAIRDGNVVLPALHMEELVERDGEAAAEGGSCSLSPSVLTVADTCIARRELSAYP